MRVYTIGFTHRDAAEFFGALRANDIKRLVDVRVSNTSQLAGFTKKRDLAFFLDELVGADYLHEPDLAPTLELMRDYRKGTLDWLEFEERFLSLLADRRVEGGSRQLLIPGTVLLCSEPTPDRCHRRLVLEYLNGRWGEIQAVHL